MCVFFGGKPPFVPWRGWSTFNPSRQVPNMAAARVAAEQYAKDMNNRGIFKATLRRKTDGWNVDVVFKNSGRKHRTMHFRAKNYASASNWVNMA